MAQARLLQLYVPLDREGASEAPYGFGEDPRIIVAASTGTILLETASKTGGS